MGTSMWATGDGPVHYRIRVQGELQAHWSAWFAGMVIEAEPDGTSVLQGVLVDQAALYGVWRAFEILDCRW